MQEEIRQSANWQKVRMSYACREDAAHRKAVRRKTTGEQPMRDRIFAYIKKKYKATPEYPWGEDDGAVLRHSDNRKWFALVMRVGRGKLGLAGDGQVDVVNLKIADRMFKDVLMQDKGILPAYHMNKEHWITVLLDGTVEEEQICSLIDLSFAATASKKKKEKQRWLPMKKQKT